LLRRFGCFGLLLLRPVPGEQLADAVHRVIGDAGEDVGEVGLRVDGVELAGLCRPSNYAERHGGQPISLAKLRAVEGTLFQYRSA